MRRPLRDALRFAYAAGFLANGLREGHRIGEAAGFAPDLVKVRAYDKAFALEGVPVQAPARFTDGGRSGAEAAFLLGEMISIGKRVGVHPITLRMAWKDISRTTEMVVANPTADAAQA